MDKVNAILEKYEGSFRITPERPTKRGKGITSTFKKVKAELFHWEESDSMDIFVIPPSNPTAATTRVVKRFSWGGSVSRSIYGKYRISLPFDDEHGKQLTLKEIQAYAAEAQKWIAEDRKNFNANVNPNPNDNEKKRKRKKS